MTKNNRYSIFLSSAVLFAFSSSRAHAIYSQSPNLDNKKVPITKLPLEYFNYVKDTKPDQLDSWLSEVGKALNGSVYVSSHNETNEVELLCFDCDSRLVESSLLLLAGNDSAGDPPSGGGSQSAK